MKRLLIISVVLVVGLIAWVNINKINFPPPPVLKSEISKTVKLNFRIGTMDLNTVELALNRGQGENNLFVHLTLSENWKKGQFGMVLKAMSEVSSVKGNSGKKADVGKFEKDNEGKKINSYPFENVLVEDDKGDTYLQMKYVGASMPMLESLTIEETIILPKSLSARFVNNKSVHLHTGTFGLDSKINGFWIPASIN